jgi:hypothetical protein
VVGQAPAVSGSPLGAFERAYHLDSETSDASGNGAALAVFGAFDGGVVDEGAAFGSATSLLVGDCMDQGDGDFTVEFWIRPDDVLAAGRVFLVADGGGMLVQLELTGRAGSRRDWRLWTRTGFDEGGAPLLDAPDDQITNTIGPFEHFVLTKQDGDVVVTIDGVNRLRGQVMDRLTDAACLFGGSSDFNGFRGVIDEIRVSDTSRSAAWVAATAKSLRDPRGFVTLP